MAWDSFPLVTNPSCVASAFSLAFLEGLGGIFAGEAFKSSVGLEADGEGKRDGDSVGRGLAGKDGARQG